MSAHDVVVISLRIDGKEIDGEFHVLDHLRRDIIIGADFMQKWSITLDPPAETITVHADPGSIELM